MDATQTDQVVTEVNEQYKEAVSAVTQQTLLDAVFKEAVAVLIIPLSLAGCFSIMAACFSCWLSSRIVLKTSPRILIVE